MIPEKVLSWAPLVGAQELNDSITENLVLSMVWQETSDGDPYAYRYEERWRYFWSVRANTSLYIREADQDRDVDANRRRARAALGATEFHAQSASYGLLQVMGSVARQYRLKGSLLQLCDPNFGLAYGVRHLWEFGFRRGSNSLRTALVKYNGSEVYAEEVLQKLGEMELRV